MLQKWDTVFPGDKVRPRFSDVARDVVTLLFVDCNSHDGVATFKFFS